METNINYTIVGAFVLILSAAIILGIIWLSSGFSDEKFSIYQINSQESVAGLNVDAVVEYNGVDVGSVYSIELDKQNPHVVLILVKIKAGTPITKGTTAMIQTRGITGVSTISLLDKSTDLTPLVANKGEQYPIIKTIPSLFLRLDSALSRLNESLTKVSNSMQSLLDPKNLENIQATLQHINEVTSVLSNNSQKLGSTINNLSLATEQLTPAIQLFSNQTLPLMDELLTNANYVSTMMRENPSVILRGVEPAPLGPGE